ncbi:hypothetical protein AAC387_Pa02g2976 [Persea americana]
MAKTPAMIVTAVRSFSDDWKNITMAAAISFFVMQQFLEDTATGRCLLPLRQCTSSGGSNKDLALFRPPSPIPAINCRNQKKPTEIVQVSFSFSAICVAHRDQNQSPFA